MSNVLLVEDQAVIRQELAFALRNKGYRVTEATDGAEAVECLTKERFNLIISDFVLPKLHGLNLVNMVHSKWPTTPVIMISGYLSQAAGSTILEGMADFLAKPIDPDVLLSRVRRLLASWYSMLVCFYALGCVFACTAFMCVVT